MSNRTPNPDPVQVILDKLEGVRPTSENQWEALCPAHEDQHASLSIGRGDDGQALVHCQAGCAVTDVLAKIDLTQADLFASDPAGPRRGAKATTNAKRRRRMVATYEYRGAEGELLFQVIRYDPKDFRQRRPDGDGHWVWGLRAGEYVQGKNGDWRRVTKRTSSDAPRRRFPEAQRVLYRLRELLAAGSSAWVFVVEGEKDCENVASMGLVATTCPQGAGKLSKVDVSQLEGRRIAIIPDNDNAGRDHAEQVARSLLGRAEDVRIVHLRDLPEKGDVTDWIDAGGTA